MWDREGRQRFRLISFVLECARGGWEFESLRRPVHHISGTGLLRTRNGSQGLRSSMAERPNKAYTA